ncbi:MAG: VWA domain-containing protein [Myxococcales bacterium]|nr:VWA domain-containing protein [Myxococcales bacterium]
MTWHAPSMLWLLGLLPLLAGLMLLEARLRRRAAGRFGLPETTRRMIGGRSAGLRATRAVLLLCGLALGLLALARPQYGSREKTLRKRGVDVVVVLDFSKSMLAQDVRPSRIERAKAELMRFISELAGDRVGIVAFAGETMEFPMTVDYAAAALFFKDLGPYDMPVGGTAIGRALTATKRLFERSSREGAEADPAQKRARVVVLLTDGEDHEGDPLEAARALAEIDAKVFVLAVGSRSGEPIPTHAADGTWTGYIRDGDGNPVLTTLSAEAEQQLRQIAEITGGAYYEPQRGQLRVGEVRKRMSTMKQTELKARRITVHEERYALVLLLAFLLILLEALLPEARFGGSPKTP